MNAAIEQPQGEIGGGFDAQERRPQPDAGVAATLLAAAELLEPPGAWTQGVYARTAHGDSLLDAMNERARCWCVSGALRRVGDGVGRPAWVALSRFLGETPSVWNDVAARTPIEVVAALRAAANELAASPQAGARDQ